MKDRLMAKKKNESTEKSAKAEVKAKKPAAKEAPKAAAKPAKSGASLVGMPMIDTNLAAQSAAQMLIARSKGGGGVSQGGSMIEQIKSDMNKGHGSTVAGVLDKGGPLNKRPNQTSNPMNQRGHNQTFGSDASRANVPRRTPG
jgi:hypothetical protein